MADLWETLPELAACETINQIKNVHEVFKFIQVSPRFKELASRCLTTLSHPELVIVPFSNLTYIPNVKWMKNVIVEVPTPPDVITSNGPFLDENLISLIRSLTLKEANFRFSSGAYMAHFLRSYFLPDEVDGGTTRKSLDVIIRIFIYSEVADFLHFIVVIDHGNVLISTGSHEETFLDDDANPSQIGAYLDFLLPLSSTFFIYDQFGGRNLVPSPRRRYTFRTGEDEIIINDAFYNLLIEAELGLTYPDQHPGPNNPPLKFLLNLFRSRISPDTVYQLVAIYLYLKARGIPPEDAEFKDPLLIKAGFFSFNETTFFGQIEDHFSDGRYNLLANITTDFINIRVPSVDDWEKVKDDRKLIEATMAKYDQIADQMLNVYLPSGESFPFRRI